MCDIYIMLTYYHVEILFLVQEQCTVWDRKSEEEVPDCTLHAHKKQDFDMIVH